MANGHGGARPGAGRKKGKVGQAKVNLAAMAREYAGLALDTLREVAENREESGSARVAAANALLDRGFGRPLQATLDVDPASVPAPFTGWAIERVKPDPRHTH